MGRCRCNAVFSKLQPTSDEERGAVLRSRPGALDHRAWRSRPVQLGGAERLAAERVQERGGALPVIVHVPSLSAHLATIQEAGPAVRQWSVAEAEVPHP